MEIQDRKYEFLVRITPGSSIENREEHDIPLNIVSVPDISACGRYGGDDRDRYDGSGNERLPGRLAAGMTSRNQLT
jgi:hypothetical protein